MRFERDTAEEEVDELPVSQAGNRWYFFVPLPLLGVWLLVSVAQWIASALVPRASGAGSPQAVDVLRDVLEVVDVMGAMGWLLLMPFYWVVLAHKRASSWWALGALCCGVNLPLYVLLLFMPARRRRLVVPVARTPSESVFVGTEPATRRRGLGLRQSFVCEACAAVLNYGVSECAQCGERYRYVDGHPVAE